MRGFEHLSAVVLDWAGTTVDHGSRAPALVFQEVFRLAGVPITLAQARGPMGMAKRDHLAAIAALPEVATAWEHVHGGPLRTVDIDALYEDFLPLQLAVLRDHSDVIPGVAVAVDVCRRRGLRIGSTTGYTRALMEVVSTRAGEQGYRPECVVAADDVARGRPAPDLLLEAARRLGVSSLGAIVAVDDTPVGIRAGRNAGCWTIGVTRTGNGVGLSLAEYEALPEPERRRLCDAAAARLVQSGAHAIVESVADIIPVLEEFEGRLARAG